MILSLVIITASFVISALTLFSGFGLGTLLSISAVFSAAISSLKKLSLSPQFIPLGGLISGFFGGLSGLQGGLV